MRASYSFIALKVNQTLYNMGHLIHGKWLIFINFEYFNKNNYYYTRILY